MRKGSLLTMMVVCYVIGCIYFKDHFYRQTFYHGLSLSYLNAYQASLKICRQNKLDELENRDAAQVILQRQIFAQNFYLWPWDCWRKHDISDRVEAIPDIKGEATTNRSLAVESQSDLLSPTTSFDDNDHLLKETVFQIEFMNRSVTLPSLLIKELKMIDMENEVEVRQHLHNFLASQVGEPFLEQETYRNYHSVYQGVVRVEPGTLGGIRMNKRVIDQIINDLRQGLSFSRIMIWVGSLAEAWPDRVEVDLKYQMMTIFKGHQIKLQVPIVSGGPHSLTVAGAYQVWAKESPARLSGYNPLNAMDYQQEVDYWIAFDNQGQGIHDAKWQMSFGGPTYIYQGSLGCINVPPSRMTEVYQLVDLGMPVFIF